MYRVSQVECPGENFVSVTTNGKPMSVNSLYAPKIVKTFSPASSPSLFSDASPLQHHIIIKRICVSLTINCAIVIVKYLSRSTPLLLTVQL